VGRELVVMSSGGALAGLTLRSSVTLFFFGLTLESVTVKVSGTAAAVAVGVPESAPDDATVSPAGSVPAVSAQERGALPPVATSVAR
jgi:hypothetical protein